MKILSTNNFFLVVYLTHAHFVVSSLCSLYSEELDPIYGTRKFATNNRYKEVIREHLRRFLKNDTTFVEITSGTGQLISYLAEKFPAITFIPCDHDPYNIPSIEFYKKLNMVGNLKAPFLFDVRIDTSKWFKRTLQNETVDYIFNSYLIHLAPPECYKALIRGVSRYLKHRGLFFLYGPFTYLNNTFPESNRILDRQLKAANPSWGLRDAELEIREELEKLDILLTATFNLPADLQLHVYKKVNSKDIEIERMQNYGAAERNKEPILDVLKSYIKADDEAFLLEIASGSGQHVAYFASYFKNVTFQPTDYHSSMISSVLAYKEHYHLQNILPAKYLNVEEDPDSWLMGGLHPNSVDYIFNSNMIHVTHYSCTEGLFRGCGRYLKLNGLLFLYGPFAYNGLITPSSNIQFDRELKSSDPLRGLRDVIQQLVPEASKHGMRLETQHQLPSNNQLLVWKKYHITDVATINE